MTSDGENIVSDKNGPAGAHEDRPAANHRVRTALRIRQRRLAKPQGGALMKSMVLDRVTSWLSCAFRTCALPFAIATSGIALGACTGEIGSSPTDRPGGSATGTTGAGPAGGNATGTGAGTGGATGTGGSVVDGKWQPGPCDSTQTAFAKGRLWLLTDLEYVNSVRDVLGVTLAGTDAQISSTGDTTGEFTNLSEGGAVFSDSVAANYQTAALNVAKQATLVAKMTSLVGATATVPATDAQLNTFISTKVSRLWRRPVSGTSPEGMALKTLYNSGTAAEDGGPANAFSVLLQAVLQAPSFLFRTELGNNPTPAAASFQLTPYELASALSMMFLESAPDDAMWAKAADGTLSDPTVLNTEVDRLMGQQVAKDNMALKLGYWLWTERVPARDKDPALFDTYTTAVRQSVYQSGQAFVKDLLANGTLADLFTSNKMWVNKDITTVYGIPGGAGATMTPTTTTLPERSSGLLTQPAFIAGVHKREALTDPIHMGLFIYEELLCDGDAGGPIPAPPADAFEKAAMMMGTEREIAGQRAMNTCVACHGRFDPFGLTYQTYDAIGRFSTTQQVVKKPDGTFTRATLPSIDTSSIIPESVGKDVAGAVANVQELAQRLNSVGPNKRVAFCAGKKLATFAMGTDPSVINSCSLRDVNERFYKSGSFLDFYRGLATSSGFATRNPG